MKNAEIAARLDEIAALMEFDAQPVFKIRAYERAARSIDDADSPVEQLLSDGSLEDLPGVGKAIAQKVADIERTGTCKYLEELRAKFPPGILELLQVPGIGNKTAVALYKELNVTSLADLRRAVESGAIAALPRLGAKSIAKLQAGLAQLGDYTKRMRLGDAWPIAEKILQALKQSEHAHNVVVAGSLRRMEPAVRDLDVICTSDDPERVLDDFAKLRYAQRVLSRGPTKATIWVGPGIAVDLRVVPHECLGNLLQHFTGSKEHNVKLREYAVRKGLKVSEYGIEEAATGRVRTASTEEGVYEMLGMQYIEPELREGLDEIALARKRALPRLVQVEDIRGDLHAHTDWSDGSKPIAEMAAAAAARGRQYLSISDHSIGRAVAGGLTAERLQAQIADIKAMQANVGIRLLCSSEVDIRADGSMDFPDEVLAQLDIVVGSIHSAFSGSKEQQTERLLRAIHNPYVNIIGHPTGRMIERRPGYEFDVDAVFKAAAKTGTALEINSNPARLDLSAELARRAKQLGCTLSIDTDAHYVADFEHLFFGIGNARKAGLTKNDVLNTRPVEDVIEFVRAKRRNKM